MAVIGDILVKFVADFAEFAAGMADGIKKLDEFGKQAHATNDKLTQFANAVKTGIKALGVEELVRRTYEYAESVQKMAADLGDAGERAGPLDRRAAGLSGGGARQRPEGRRDHHGDRASSTSPSVRRRRAARPSSTC